MPIDGINPYQGATNTTSSKTGGNSLSMDDFFSLLVAQMSNQDMYNTMDDSQFMTQMAQFSMVQAMADLSKSSATAYSMSLIGKEVTLAQEQKDGTLAVNKGIVEGVTLFNGESELLVDGKKYALTSVMEVRQPNIIIPKEPLPEKVLEVSEVPLEPER